MSCIKKTRYKMLGWQQNGQPSEPKNNPKSTFKKLNSLSYDLTFKFKSFKISCKAIKFKFSMRYFLSTSKASKF